MSILPLQGQTSIASPVVTLKRTHCFGTCPVYELSVFADGTVEWNGKQYVGTVGEASAMLSKQQVDDLIQTLAASRFSTFQNSYKSQTTDLPTTFLTFTYDGATKTTAFRIVVHFTLAVYANRAAHLERQTSELVLAAVGARQVPSYNL